MLLTEFFNIPEGDSYADIKATSPITETKSHISPSGVKTNMSPKDDDYAINYGKQGSVAKFRKNQGLDVKTGTKNVAEEFNPKDTITMDVPLFIRLLEYSREDAKTDMDLHNVAERIIDLSQSGQTLTMADYDRICPSKE